MKRKFFSALLCAMISFCLIVSSAACAPEENKEPDDGGPPIVTPQPDDDKDNETPGEDPDGEGDPSGEGPGEDETPEEEPPSESGLTFELHSDGYTCYVSGIGTCTDTEIVIPDTHNGSPVVNIGGHAFSGSDIKSIVIPDSVVGIGEGAFSGCTSLTDVTLGAKTQTIKAQAFQGCTNLTNINIPESVTTIGEGAFSGCDKLEQTENGVHYIAGWVID